MNVFQGSRLVRTAFFDAPFLVTTLNVAKNYALAGDAAHGAIFVHYTVGAYDASVLGSRYTLLLICLILS